MTKPTNEKSRREEYSEATREALIASARAVFATVGYAAAATEAIARTARVTRGAFYHHFEDKKALFDAVVVAMQVEATHVIRRRARTKKDLWEKLNVGIDAYLDACVEPAYSRVVVRDAPTVLGPERFKEIDETYPMALLTANLAALRERGEIDLVDVELASRMLDAMICKLALVLPTANDPAATRRNGTALLQKLLDSLRPSASSP